MYDNHISNKNYYRFLKKVSSTINGHSFKTSSKELADEIQFEYDCGLLCSSQYDDLMSMVGGHHCGLSKGVTTFKEKNDRQNFDITDKSAAYAINNTVVHDRYGLGKVVLLDRRYVTIKFENGQESKFIPENFYKYLKVC